MKKCSRVQITSIQKIVVSAFIVRLILLFSIYLIFDYMEEGFVESSVYYDDYRYEQGAIYYASEASSLIDVGAFTAAFESVGDRIGYRLLTPFQSTPFWYWAVCVLCYVTKSIWGIRLFNILISSLAIAYIYKFADLIYGEPTAKMSALLMAFLPYPVIFSCFSYKDQLVLYITFYLLSVAAKYRQCGRIKINDAIGAIIMASILMLTRSGLSIVLFLICFVIALIKDVNFRKLKIRLLIAGSIALIVGSILMIRYSGTIMYKLLYYLERHTTTLGNTNIAFVTINGVKDLYKLPFTYLFSIIMPISLFSKPTSWYAIVANFNIVMCPIAIGALMYIAKKKKEKVVYWSCLALYIISIVTSINIFRHYYSLIPLTIISFSDFMNTATKQEKVIFLMGTIAYITMVITFYTVR